MHHKTGSNGTPDTDRFPYVTSFGPHSCKDENRLDVEKRMGYRLRHYTGLQRALGENLAFLATEPLPVHHSWPLYEKARHFGMGQMMNCAVTNLAEATEAGSLGSHHSGVWVCDLADNSLIWSNGVYDIFGLPRGVQISRNEAAALYSAESGAAMESLRAYAIEHKRGFTLDVEINPAIGQQRLMRLIAAPVCEGDRVVRLHGLKFII